MFHRSYYFCKVYTCIFFPLVFLFLFLSQFHGDQLVNGSGLVYMLPILFVLPATNYVQIVLIPLIFTMFAFISEGIPYMLEVLGFFILWLALTKLPEKRSLIGYILFTLLCFVVNFSASSYYWIMMGLLWGFSLSDLWFREKNGSAIIDIDTEESLSFPRILNRTTYKLVGLCFLLPTGIYYFSKKKLIWEGFSRSKVIVLDESPEIKVPKRNFITILLRIPQIVIGLSILSIVLQTGMIMLFSLIYLVTGKTFWV